MRVIVNNSVYEMTRKQFKSIIAVVTKTFCAKFGIGIIAVEKDLIAEMKNEPYADETSLKLAIKGYEDNGFKVYWRA